MDALDMSNFTTHFTVENVYQWKATGVGLAIVQLVSGVRLSGDDCATQIATCLQGGLAVDVYLFPGNDGLPLTTAQRLALIPPPLKPQIRQGWIDIEPAYRDPTQAEVNSAHTVTDATLPWQQTGDYSAYWVASKPSVHMLPWPWPSRKQWLVNATGVANLGGGFSGTNNHVLTQYAEDVILAGVSGMDRSLLSDSEAAAVTAWLERNQNMALNVGQGLRDRMAANNDHPVSDEATLLANSDESVIQAAYGTQGRYFASNASGNWEAWGPAPWTALPV